METLLLPLPRVEPQEVWEQRSLPLLLLAPPLLLHSPWTLYTWTLIRQSSSTTAQSR